MAPSPPRRIALVMLLSLLLLSVVAYAARTAPAPASSRGHHAELQQGQDKEVDSKEGATAFTAAAEDDPCGGGAGEGGEAEEECLMRRTLVAHTDYIYTQGGSHN